MEQFTNPYADPGTYDPQVSEKQAAINLGTKTLAKNIRGVGDVKQAFNQMLRKRGAGVKGELKRAFKQFSNIDNPIVRNALMNSTEAAIRGRRQNAIADTGQILQNKLQAQQVELGNERYDLQNLLTDRNAARQNAAQLYLGQVNSQQQSEWDAEQRKRGLQDMRDQYGLQKELGVGAYAPRGGGGSPVRSSFQTLPDGTIGSFNPVTGEFTVIGSVDLPASTQIIDDGAGGSYVVDKGTGEVINKVELPQEEEEAPWWKFWE